ncbi:MAG: hypothetical protein V2A77_01715 [Pseudomonadota bacterium]
MKRILGIVIATALLALLGATPALATPEFRVLSFEDLGAGRGPMNHYYEDQWYKDQGYPKTYTIEWEAGAGESQSVWLYDTSSGSLFRPHTGTHHLFYDGPGPTASWNFTYPTVFKGAYFSGPERTDISVRLKLYDAYEGGNWLNQDKDGQCLSPWTSLRTQADPDDPKSNFVDSGFWDDEYAEQYLKVKRVEVEADWWDVDGIPDPEAVWWWSMDDLEYSPHAPIPGGLLLLGSGLGALAGWARKKRG